MVDWARILQGRVKIGSLQETEFELGRVTAQGVILRLPSLINNLYFVICIGLIQSYLRHLTLSAHSRTAGIFIHALHVKPFLAIIVLVVIPILLGQPFWVMLPVAVDH